MSDIVGYTYRAEELCPVDILAVTGLGTALEQVDQQVEVDRAESALDWWAEQVGVDRADEHTFDSGDFPKVITKQQARGELPFIMRCILCSERLN